MSQHQLLRIAPIGYAAAIVLAALYARAAVAPIAVFGAFALSALYMISRSHRPMSFNESEFHPPDEEGDQASEEDR